MAIGRPRLPVTSAEVRRAVLEAGSSRAAAKMLGVSHGTVDRRMLETDAAPPNGIARTAWRKRILPEGWDKIDDYAIVYSLDHSWAVVEFWDDGSWSWALFIDSQEDEPIEKGDDLDFRRTTAMAMERVRLADAVHVALATPAPRRGA